jgi:hypothetical protein
MNIYELIEEHGLTLHGDIEHFAELVRQDEREQLTLAAECFRVCEQKEVCNEKATNNEANRTKILGKG